MSLEHVLRGRERTLGPAGHSLSLSAIAILAFAACGGGTPAPVGPANGGTSSDSPSATKAPPAMVTAAPAAWGDGLSHDEKLAFMKGSFAPALAPVFEGHDARRFASFGCKTCHGPDSKPQPRDFLPHLTLTADGKGIAEFATKPEFSKFMVEVELAAAKSFGKPAFDVKTGQGFGCAGCHMIDKSDKKEAQK
jgi:hypothetical protein